MINIPSTTKSFPRPMFQPQTHMAGIPNSLPANGHFTIPPHIPSMFAGPVVSPPRSDLIFEGHITNRPHHGAESNHQGTVHEISFKSQQYFVEGLHIVPNKIKVPGTNFVGKTIPDMNMRPFSLHIFARVLFPDVSKEPIVQHILSVTINGGIEWLAIPHPFDQLPIDYLAFDGDFEVLSMTIHGKIVGPSIYGGEGHLPVPFYYHDISLETNEVELELVCEDPKPTVENKELESLSNKISAIGVKHSMYDYLNGVKLPQNFPISEIDYRYCRKYSKSLVPIQSVAELVEQVFTTQRIISGDIVELNRLLEKCWEVYFYSVIYFIQFI